MLIDSSGRKIDYLRISLTQKCSLRCVYCMRQECKVQNDEKYEGFVRAAKAAALLGISKIRLTGGEPLMYEGIENLTGEIKRIDGIKHIGLTTNGLALDKKLDLLLKNGLDSVNISLDAYNRYLYKEITGFDGFDTVLCAIKNACEKIPVKINSVLLSSDAENITGIALLAKELPVSVRFIELMPFGPAAGMHSVSENEIIKILEQKFGKFSLSNAFHGSGPARYFHAEGFKGDIGFISAMSHSFCQSCNRIRLTSDFLLKTCIQYPPVLDLKPFLYGDIETLAEKIREHVLQKPPHHDLCSHPCTCPMFTIGG